MSSRHFSIALAVALVVPLGAPPAAEAAEPSPAVPSPATEVRSVTGEIQRYAVDLDGGTGLELTVVVPENGEAVRVEPEELADVPSGTVADVTVAEVDETTQEITDPDGGATVVDVDVVAPAPEADGGSGGEESHGGTAMAARLDPAVDARGPRPVHLFTGTISGQDRDAVRASHLAADITGKVSPYWSDSTGGAYRFAVASTKDAITYSSSWWGDATTCTTAQFSKVLASISTAAGVSIGQGKHAVLYTPRLAACPFSGVGHVADGGAVWINGGADPTRRWEVIAHELGHNMNLGHSDSRVRCPEADAAAAHCHIGGYGDAYDVMGTSTGGAGPLSGAHLDTLGLLTSASRITATSSRKVTLKPVGGLSGVRFVTFTTGDVHYYVEYRGAVERDADLVGTRSRKGCAEGVAKCTQYTSYEPGVVIRRVDEPGRGADSHLLDASVGRSATRVGSPAFVLPTGHTFTTADGKVSVTTSALTGGTATIDVTFGPLPPAPSEPNEPPAPTAPPGPVVTEPVRAPFPDVPATHSFVDEITWLVGAGITTGYGSGHFGPYANVTREQFAAFLYRYTHDGAKPATCTRRTFPDVPTSSQFCGHIAWLAGTGITTGYGGGQFGPKDKITRDQIAVMLRRYRALDGSVDATCDRRLFTDITTSSFCGSITWLAGTGITTGYANGNFYPSSKVTRQHMAAFLYRYDQTFGPSVHSLVAE